MNIFIIFSSSASDNYYLSEGNDLIDPSISGTNTPVLAELTSSVFSSQEEEQQQQPKEQEEEDAEDDSIEDLNALRAKLISQAQAKKKSKKTTKSTDDDEPNADEIASNITRARRGSAEEQLKNLASTLLDSSSIESCKNIKILKF